MKQQNTEVIDLYKRLRLLMISITWIKVICNNFKDTLNFVNYTITNDNRKDNNNNNIASFVIKGFACANSHSIC